MACWISSAAFPSWIVLLNVLLAAVMIVWVSSQYRLRQIWGWPYPSMGVVSVYLWLYELFLILVLLLAIRGVWVLVICPLW